LAHLPLALSDLEDQLLLPSYGPQCVSTAMPFGPAARQAVTMVRAANWSSAVRETTTASRIGQMTAAVVDWVNESNGKVESHVFCIGQLQPIEVAQSLFELRLESIGRVESIQVRWPARPNEALTLLFSAAANGGAYTRGREAAYGRLLAWKSLGGLVGCGENARIDEIERAARSCQWCLFDAESEWFHRIAWDLGIACWNPHQCELSVLAATDTD
jgi:hypothetical protein